MPRELHSGDAKIDQRAVITDLDNVEAEIIEADASLLKKEYLDELAFMDEPVRIRLHAGTEKNAAPFVEVWCNGERPEVLINGRWARAPSAHLPVGIDITTKRKFVEPILRSKINRVETRIQDPQSEHPVNHLDTTTMMAHAISILEDTPRGHAWASEMMRRHY